MNYKDLGYDDFLSSQPNLPNFLSTGALTNLEGLDASQIVTLGRIQSPDGQFYIDFNTGDISLPQSSVATKNVSYYVRGFKAVVSVNGGGDYTDIQEAIDYVHRNGGGQIFIKQGTYYPTASIQLYTEIQLVGDGINRTIIDFSRCSGHTGQFYNTYTIDDISTITYPNQHNINNISISNMSIQNAYSDDGTIALYCVRNPTIENVYFYYCKSFNEHGHIYLNTCYSALVRKTMHYLTLDNGYIDLLGGSVLVDNCYIQSGIDNAEGLDSNMLYGIRSMASGVATHHVIQNNYVDMQGARSQGIKIDSTSENYSEAIIKNNRLYNVGGNNAYATIEINTNGNGMQRILIDGNIISGPAGTIAAGDIGIGSFCEGQGTAAQYIAIVNNIISRCGRGIMLDKISNSIVNNNITDACTVGLLINNTCDRILYTGNHFKGATTPVTDNGTNSNVGHNVVT